MFRATNAPILKSIFCLYIQLLVQYNALILLPTGDKVTSFISTSSPVGSNIGAFYQKLYIQSKHSPEDGRICRPKHVELI